jgi:hypothetical protein
VLLSRNGHKKRKQHLKLELLSMGLANGVLYLRSNVDLKVWFFGHNLLDRVYSKGESVDFCHFIFFSSFHHEKLKQKVYDELYSSA